LAQAAAKVGSIGLGPVFQALLARSGWHEGHGARPGSERHSSLDLESSFGQAEVQRLTQGAVELCSLLRLKVEDDGDLVAARSALRECRTFMRRVFAEEEAEAEEMREAGPKRAGGTWELFLEASRSTVFA